jgi:hypothetical protein
LGIPFCDGIIGTALVDTDGINPQHSGDEAAAQVDEGLMAILGY